MTSILRVEDPAARSRRSVGMVRIAACIALLLPGACSDPGVECLNPLPVDCVPQYEPTFENVYSNTLEASCSVGGGSCHTSQGAKGGLVLDDPDTAYQHLVEESARVIPGDPECSPLMWRLEAAEPGQVMPPGSPLSEIERCAIMTWIRDGAKR